MQPPESRIEILKAIFPHHVLRRIVDLIDIDPKSKEKLKGYAALKFPCEGPLTFPPISPFYMYTTDEPEDQGDDESISLSSSTSTSSMKNNVPLWVWSESNFLWKKIIFYSSTIKSSKISDFDIKYRIFIDEVIVIWFGL